MNQRGRPFNEKQIICEHQSRPQKAQVIKEFYTEHRVTLITYQAQYIYAKQPKENTEVKKGKGQKLQQQAKKKKCARKKVNLQFQSGFLKISQQRNEEFNVKDDVKNYQYLNHLFSQNMDEDLLQVKEFMSLMLQLKHSSIVTEFYEIYNLIAKYINEVKFQQIQKQKDRFQSFEAQKQKILTFIQNNQQKFPYFLRFLAEDGFETKKLIIVEIYCFVAQKFNFNINQYYSDAFSLTIQPKPSKKVKVH